MTFDLSNFKKKLLIVCGPTASGKTDFFENLCRRFPQTFECINADTGQMYQELSIGTAKPDLGSLSNPEEYHLFNILNLGELCSAGQFRVKVEELAKKIWAKHKTPVVVGGSMFYVQSLFFPPKDPVLPNFLSVQAIKSLENLANTNVPTKILYDQLLAIDPARAAAIMPNDKFRILRALEIWFKSGVKPSALEPQFEPIAETEILFVSQLREILDDRIGLRLKIMLSGESCGGWLEEARKIYARPKIRKFIMSSRLIGYKEIFEWLDAGGQASQLPTLEERLYFATRNYSKKQIKFWNALERKILAKDSAGLVKIIKANGVF